MALIPCGQRTVGSTVKAVNAETFPRKRHRTTGFNVKGGAYVAPKRPANHNDRAARITPNGSGANGVRLFVAGRSGVTVAIGV